MIFDLLQDLAAVIEEMPAQHARRPLLRTVHGLLRRNLRSLESHPTTLFQALWNELVESPTSAIWVSQEASSAAPVSKPSSESTWMQHWLIQKVAETPEFPWLRLIGSSHAPPEWDETLLNPSPVVLVAMTPDNRYLAAVDSLREVTVWDAQTNVLLSSHRFDFSVGHPSLLEFSSEGRFLAYGTHDGGVAVIDWRADTVVYRHNSKHLGSGVQEVWFASDSSTVTFVDIYGRYAEYQLIGETPGELGLESAALGRRGTFRQDGAMFWSFDFKKAAASTPGRLDTPGEYLVYVIDCKTGTRRDVLHIEGSLGLANLVVSPDGTRFAWCEGHRVQVFDGQSGALLARIEAPVDEQQVHWYFPLGDLTRRGELTAVWSSDSRTLVLRVVSTESSLQHSHDLLWVWNVDNNEIVWSVPIRGKFANPTSTAISTCRRHLLIAANGLRILSQGDSPRELTDARCTINDEIVAYSLSEDCRSIAVATRGGDIHLLCPDDRRITGSFLAQTRRQIELLKVSSIGEWVAWWQRQQMDVRLYLADCRTREEQLVATGYIGDIVFSKTGDLMISAGSQLLCLETHDLERRHVIDRPSQTSLYFYALSRDGQWLAMSSQQACLWKLSLNVNDVQLVDCQDAADARDLQLDADGRRVIVRVDRPNSHGRFLTGTFGPLNDAVEWQFEEEDKLITRMVWGPGPECITCSRRPGILKLIHPQSRAVIAESRVSEAEMFHIDVSDDGRWIAGAGFDGVIRLVDLMQGGTVQQIRAYGKSASYVQFNGNGSRLLTLGDDEGRGRHLARVWDVESGERLCEFSHAKGVLAASISPDGSRLAASCGDQVIRVWDIDHSETQWELPTPGHGPNPFQAAFNWSPDGKRLFHSTPDGYVIARDAYDGREIHRWQLPVSKIVVISVMPDGQTLIVGGNSSAVHIRDAKSGRYQSLLRGHSDEIRSVRFSSPADQCVTFGAEGDVVLWEVESGRQLARHRFPFDHGRTRPVHLTRDGHVFMDGPAGVTVWHLESGVQLLPTESLRILKEAISDGFCPVVLNTETEFALIDRCTALPLVWFWTSSIDCQSSGDGSRWALLEQGQLTLLDLYIGEHRFSGSP